MFCRHNLFANVLHLNSFYLPRLPALPNLCLLGLLSKKCNKFSVGFTPFLVSYSKKSMDFMLKAPSEASLVVVDTDPGTDDAMALYMLLKAHDKGFINLLGITCVNGNTDVDNGTRNALRVLSSVNKLKIPVYRGAPEPLIVEPQPKDAPASTLEQYHGADGFGGSTFDPEPDMSLLQKQPGVLLLIELARKHKGKLNVVCLGPLTNLALAIKSDPEFASNLQQLYIMGGNFTARGNITSAAEFNFHCDPEAAHIVLASGQCHITLVPWETCCHMGISYEWRHEVLGTAGTPQTELLNKIEKSVLEKSRNPHWFPCDSSITAVMIFPAIIKDYTMCHLTVELHGGRTRGQVVLDHRQEFENNVKMIRDADKELFKELILFSVDHPDCKLKF